MAKEKERLDVLLVNRGLATSREKAKTLIMAGDVFVNGQREDKPGTTFEEAKITSLEVKGDTLPYVSRGGLKLEKAVNNFGFSLEGKVCMDIGASTGGFTDCMLQNGASRVYAIDVGTGQLHPSLLEDPRVISLEQTNIRYVDESIVPELCDLATFDLSFISLEKTVPAIAARLKDDGCMVCLIKPQFEAGREEVGKKGVVRDKAVHRAVVQGILDFAPTVGLSVLGLDYSPIKGPEGNIEYICHMVNRAGLDVAVDVDAVVARSHEEL